MNKSEAFPSKYLKAEDLRGRRILVEIAEVAGEEIKSKEGKSSFKQVCYFKNGSKGLVLNMTNWDAIAEHTGETDSDNWPGHKLYLYPTKVKFGSKDVPAIRTAPASPPSGKVAAPTPEPEEAQGELEGMDVADDQIPF
jgi:hypothetical protein